MTRTVSIKANATMGRTFTDLARGRLTPSLRDVPRRSPVSANLPNGHPPQRGDVCTTRVVYFIHQNDQSPGSESVLVNIISSTATLSQKDQNE